MDVVLVSACLVGVECRYDGASKPSVSLIEQIKCSGVVVVPVCPEQLGGLPTPRAPNEIIGGDGGDVLDGRAMVKDSNGVDRTENFLRGAHQTLAIARLLNTKTAYLKQRSPSCGFGLIKRGKEVVRGNGVTAELLARNGIKIVAVD